MDLSLDAATRKRLDQTRELGQKHIRPLGLEADRLGRPTPPDHPFFEMLVRLGLGRTRWSENAATSEPASGPRVWPRGCCKSCAATR